jgi:23S rRNA (adenine2503-C2)-methyltransferase
MVLGGRVSCLVLFILSIILTLMMTSSPVRAFSIFKGVAFKTPLMKQNSIFRVNNRMMLSSTTAAASPSSSTSSPVTMPPAMPIFTSIYSLSEDDLKTFVKSTGEKQFRAKQIRDWIYTKGVTNFDTMLNIPVSLRDALKTTYQFGSLSIAKELISKDGTIKRAYKLHDGQIIESVLMPYRDGRLTACISSQAGCAMRCSFCATGQMGFSRQLTSAEIFEQVQHFYNLVKMKNEENRISNVVMMGMGEPLANYDNVMTAIRRMNSELGIGARHITVSTVGLVPRIYDLAKEDMQVNLAVSLHQANDEKRSALMPVNKRFPIAKLLEACRHYIEATNRRISFEWALIQGQTDSKETAHELGTLLEGMLCHVNLIPLNPTTGFDGKPTGEANAQQFIDILAQYHVTATMRVRRGKLRVAGDTVCFYCWRCIFQGLISQLVVDSCQRIS